MSTYCTSPKGNSQPGREESQTVRVKVRGAFCPDPMFLSFFLMFCNKCNSTPERSCIQNGVSRKGERFGTQTERNCWKCCVIRNDRQKFHFSVHEHRTLKFIFTHSRSTGREHFIPAAVRSHTSSYFTEFIPHKHLCCAVVRCWCCC